MCPPGADHAETQVAPGSDVHEAFLCHLSHGLAGGRVRNACCLRDVLNANDVPEATPTVFDEVSCRC